MEVVAEASDGMNALARAAEVKPDVVVLDLTMPGMSGLTAARALSRNSPPTPVVALTRHDDEAYVQELLRAGASAYILKQSASAELLHAIRVAATGGRYLDPGLPPATHARDPRRRAKTPPVTERETAVLRMMAVGHSNKDIATTMDISVKTVE